MLLQYGDGVGRQGDAAAASICLRLHEVHRSTHALKGVANLQLPRLEVNVLPAKPERLSLPQSCSQGDGHERLQPIPLHGYEDRPRISG